MAAARAAGLAVVVPRSAYFGESTIEGVLAIGPGLHERGGWQPGLPAAAEGLVRLVDIDAWRAR